MKKLFPLLLFLLLFAVRAGAQTTASATLTVSSTGCQNANSCVALAVPNGYGSATFTVSANTGTVAFDALGGDAATWVPINSTPSNGSTAATTATSTGVWQANVAAFAQVRMRLSAAGSATVAINVSVASAKSGGGGAAGAAGGDLSGLYPNPGVAKILGMTPAASATTDTTNASNISSGTLANARSAAVNLAAGNVNGGVTGNLPNTNVAGLAASATTDTTNAANISSGVLASARGGAGTVNGALKGNGSGTTSQAACADLSNAAASCSTDTTNAANISSGTLPVARVPAAIPVSSVGSVGLSGTLPIAVAASGAVSCPTCLANNGTVGGVVGGWFGTTSAVGDKVAIGGATNSSAYGSVLPFAALFGNVYVVTSTSQPNSNTYEFTWGFWPGYGSGNFVGGQWSGIVTIPPNAAAGVYAQNLLAPTSFYVPGFTGVYAIFDGVATGAPSNVRGVSWDIRGTTSTPLSWYGQNQTIAGSTTVYVAPSQVNGLTITAEGTQGVLVPYASTAKNLCISNSSTQSSNNSLVVTLRQTTSGVTSSTTLTTTIPLSGVTGAYCDTTHTVSLSAGDWIDFQLANNANVTSTGIFNVAMELVPSGNATGTIIFGTQGRTIASGSAKYAIPFSSATLDTTEANQRFAMPRAVTMKNLACLYTTPPGTSSVTATVVQNGTPGALTVTILTTGSGNQIVTDSTHTMTFAAGDTFDLQFNQASGSNPAVSSCSVEVD